MIIKWDDLHEQSREEICSRAAVNLDIAKLPWQELDSWLRILLQKGLERSSNLELTEEVTQ